MARRQGQRERAWPPLEEAAQLAAAAGDQRELAKSRSRMGIVHLERGNLDEAARYLELARADMEALGAAEEAGNACHNLGMVCEQAGRHDEAVRWLERARGHFERCGARLGVAGCLNQLGEIARSRGDIERAEALYRAALALYEALGAANIVLGRINLGLVLVERGMYAEARAALEQSMRMCRAQNRRALLGGIHTSLLPCAAAVADWAGWDEHLASAERLLGETSFVHVDLANMARRGGELALGAGDRARARQAFRLALGQWTVLGREREMEDMQAALAACDAAPE
jgi:tetratricopeptide (TPR) repeat protein